MPRRNPVKKHTPYAGVSSCGQKRRYKSEDEVLKAIEIIELQRPSVSLSHYRCPYCGGWHLTSRPKDT